MDILLAERVVPIDEQRQAKIAVGMFKAIVVGDKCSLVDEFTGGFSIPCHFERKRELVLFMYQVPEGTYVHDKTAKRTMVYLERERLLVPQSIYRFAFERVRN